jgi:hypothetical protein
LSLFFHKEAYENVEDNKMVETFDDIVADAEQQGSNRILIVTPELVDIIVERRRLIKEGNFIPPEDDPLRVIPGNMVVSYMVAPMSKARRADVRREEDKKNTRTIIAASLFPEDPFANVAKIYITTGDPFPDQETLRDLPRDALIITLDADGDKVRQDVVADLLGAPPMPTSPEELKEYIDNEHCFDLAMADEGEVKEFMALEDGFPSVIFVTTRKPNGEEVTTSVCYDFGYLNPEDREKQWFFECDINPNRYSGEPVGPAYFMLRLHDNYLVSVADAVQAKADRESGNKLFFHLTQVFDANGRQKEFERVWSYQASGIDPAIRPNYVGADHCQEGSSKLLWKLEWLSVEDEQRHRDRDDEDYAIDVLRREIRARLPRELDELDGDWKEPDAMELEIVEMELRGHDYGWNVNDYRDLFREAWECDNDIMASTVEERVGIANEIWDWRQQQQRARPYGLRAINQFLENNQEYERHPEEYYQMIHELLRDDPRMDGMDLEELIHAVDVQPDAPLERRAARRLQEEFDEMREPRDGDEILPPPLLESDSEEDDSEEDDQPAAPIDRQAIRRLLGEMMDPRDGDEILPPPLLVSDSDEDEPRAQLRRAWGGDAFE